MLKLRARKRAAEVGVSAKFKVGFVVPHDAHKHVRVCFLEPVVCTDEVVPVQLWQRRRCHRLDFKLCSGTRAGNNVVVSAVSYRSWNIVPPQPLQHHRLTHKPNDVAFAARNAVFQLAHFVGACTGKQHQTSIKRSKVQDWQQNACIATTTTATTTTSTIIVTGVLHVVYLSLQ